MYSTNDDINKEKYNKMNTPFRTAIEKSCKKSISLVTSFLRKEPICQDTKDNKPCSVISRPMYQDVTTKSCQLPKINKIKVNELPDDTAKPPEPEIIKVQPPKEIVKTPEPEIPKIQSPKEIIKTPESEISDDKQSSVTEISVVQDLEDKTLPISMEIHKSPEKHICGKIILVESLVFRRKSLWITPKPSSIYKEHYKSIPKIMNIKY